MTQPTFTVYRLTAEEFAKVKATPPRLKWPFETMLVGEAVVYSAALAKRAKAAARRCENKHWIDAFAFGTNSRTGDLTIVRTA